jgi:DNA-binding beta-propeller fold protein YncE
MLMIARWLRIVVVMAVSVMAGGVLFGSASASAAGEHVFSGSFGEPGAGAGQLSEPSGIAVNEETGNVYVVDRGNNRVEEFNSTGSALLGEFSGSAAPTGAFSAPEGIAVDNSTNPLDSSRGAVYVVDTGHEVVDRFSAAGVYEGQLTKGANGAPFTELEGVAVDPAGAVWVYQRNSKGAGEIDSFSSGLGNEFLFSRKSPFGAGPGFAVDAEDNLYVHRASPLFAKLNSFGQELIGEVDGEESTGATTDEDNNVYIDNLGSVAELSPAGSLLEQFGTGHLTAGSGVAVDSATSTVYVADSATSTVVVFTAPVLPAVSTGQASNLQSEGSATLNGVVDPRGVVLTSCTFEYGSEESYGQTASCTAIPSGSSAVAVHADVSVTPGVLYHYRLLVESAGGARFGKDHTFFASTHPRISGEATADLAMNSATLQARVNPEGPDVTYHFEWGTSTAYGTSTPVPDADIGAGTSDVPVSAHLTGLSADTTYHWRVLATNATGTSTGPDHTFIYATSTAGLPDGRAYEMVSPAHRNGAVLWEGALGAGTPGEPDVAENGSRVIMGSVQCFAGAGSCSRTSSGWMTTALAPPATRYDQNTQFKVSADSGSALFSMATAPTGEDDFYARGLDGSFMDIGPLSSPAEGIGTEGIGTNSNNSVDTQKVLATADLSHLVFDSFDSTWPFDPARGLAAFSLYEYAGSGNAQPQLVGVSGGPGSTDLISLCGTELAGTGYAGTYGHSALSADGRIVYFRVLSGGGSPCPSGSGANAGIPVPVSMLYARIDQAWSVPIAQRSPLDCTGECLSSPPAPASFTGASMDGSKAFFTSTQRLTDNASEDTHEDGGGCVEAKGANGCNLYEYDFANPAGHNLLAVSAGDTSGGGPRVQGVVAISSDGAHVYFVAQGVLTGVANSQGQVAHDGAENLYVFERDASHPQGQVAFIATLLNSSEVNEEAANVTPDGRFLVFKSFGALTPDARPGGPGQVYRYDAQSRQLVRISIGERGFNDNGNAGVGGASIVPAWQSFGRVGWPRTDPTMSHDGAYVFFTSPVGLTSGALNGVPINTKGGEGGGSRYAINVYEYHEGHVSLISDGRDTALTGGNSSVKLVGSDATGANVFFMTADPLVAQDTDTQSDVYDARICTAGDPCITSAPPPVSCQGEGCRGTTGGTPSLLSPASTVSSGAGNLAPPQGRPTVKRKAKAKHGKHGKAKRGRKGHKARRSTVQVKRGRK